MSRNPISLVRLRELLNYSPETGVFTRKVRTSNAIHVGQVAGWRHSEGYLIVNADGRRYYAHRLAWFYVFEYWPIDEIDHINGARADNRIANLREATSAQNKQNQRKAQPTNKSGLLGVSWLEAKGYFIACIGYEGKQKYLGQFQTAEEAHRAYLIAKAELHSFSTIPLEQAA